ncbi:gamma-glutamyltransferase family protein [Sphingomonas sp. DG1-23]|uniref:gamma-glutamyltransferase family protein n=1 Tax=Sphingomonas sp. DG1-23 TaxID=3068316 RepID=UPI0027401866|nr:gamma-glutamyltransferase family protein [Sphingomonas sp. DG1-23]MDP5277840.1 gamma-glutamyltransferase family protein [Sphingomonas sp. DG1-23]
MRRMVALLIALFLPFAASAQGIVSAADPRAAAAGVEILRKGGTATDAAIATMLALNVVEPASAGIGGGAFFVVYDAKRKTTTTVDGREAAPMAADSRWFYADGKPLGIRDAIPGGRSVGVPGTLRAMAMAHRRGGKLPWATLFEPAIRLARDGFAVTPRFNGALGRFRHGDAAIRAIFYDPDGKPRATVRNPEQADLFERVAKFGPDAFYVGPQAAKLVATVNNAARNPSKMTVGDLAAYEAKERPVLCGTYRRHKICSMGPVSSGGTAVLMILKQLERFDMAKLGKDSPVAWHLFAESSRLAYADRDMYLGDPDYVRIPLKGLLAPQYIARRSALISPTGSMATIAPGTPPGAPPRVRASTSEVAGTTSLSVADGAGNVAQVTTTIESPFGSGLSVDGTMLNNELTDFDIVPEKDGILVANRVEGGKRPRSSMAPTIVYGPDGKVRLAVGAAGGSTIIAQVAKAIIGVVDWKLSAQDAIALGLVYAPGPVALIEKGTEREAMIPALEALGEKVQAAPLGLKANAIEQVGGRWAGAADPRSEGVAMHQDGRVPEIKRFGAVPNRPSE